MSEIELDSLMKIFQKRAKILDNFRIISGYYKLILRDEEIAQTARPGQCVMLKFVEGYQPLLRRPFSIHSVKTSRIEILYEIVGKGTEILSFKKAGEYLDVLGALGNGFSMLDSRCSILVGGGIGVAPLLYLAQRLTERTAQNAQHKALVLIGAKTKKEILSKKEFANLGLDVKISTDDGSAGFKGKVTELLKKILSTMDCGLSTIYACGPEPMLKEITEIARIHKIPAQISLEEYMACGLGVCLGCMVKTKGGYQAVCKVGPVFDSMVIKW